MKTMIRRGSLGLVAVLLSAASWSCAASLPAHAKASDRPASTAPDSKAVMWREPGPAASLNLLYGAGGKAHAPDPRSTYTFLEEDLLASSPKFSVKDAQGVEWKVKLGQETGSETAAARFLWAAGYFVDEDYYLAELTVKGLPELHRGQEFVFAAETVRGARLERKLPDVGKHGTWDWFDNPFTGTRALNGLRIMMALVNNWDLKAVNNQVYDMAGGHRYVVTDLGASFGNTGNVMTRSKSEPLEYADAAFIEKSTPNSVDLVMHSRPFVLSAIDLPNYQMRARIEGITRTIPRGDARWLGRRLSQLSDAQIGDALRAGGYSAQDVAVYTHAFRTRLSALKGL